jgi:hypothetical protein
MDLQQPSIHSFDYLNILNNELKIISIVSGIRACNSNKYLTILGSWIKLCF